MCVVAIAFELEHAVDEMLEDARAGDRAVLRDVADEDGRDAELLRRAHEPRRRLAYLRHRSRRRADLRGIQRLHRVDHADVGPLGLERRQHRFELGLRQDLDLPGTPQTLGAELDLRDGLLTCDEQGSPVLRHGRERREQERRLTDPRLAPDEHERSRHEAAAKNAIELGNAGGDARGLVGLDVDEPQQGLGWRLACRAADDVLHERPEGVATRALSEPAAGCIATVGAGVVDGGPGHHVSLGVGPDGNRAVCVTTYAATARSRAPAAASLRHTTSIEFPSGS